MDLSAPLGHSVNDGINRELCTFHYTSISDAATRLCTLGNGALLAKMDIEQAYHNIPVSPDDKYLLGISWENMVYVDQVLPFGLRSAPLIFSAVADALLWIMQKRGVTWAIHYIDDLLTLGAPDSSECFRNMQLMEETCTRAGLPIEPSKSVGPATFIVFLGIKLDSVSGTLRLPENKLLKIKESLAKWRDCLPQTRLALTDRSLIPRGIFLWRLIDLSTSPCDGKTCGSLTSPSGVAASHGWLVAITRPHSVLTDMPGDPCCAFYCMYCSAVVFSWLKPQRVASLPENLEYNMVCTLDLTCVVGRRLAMVPAIDDVIRNCLSTFQILHATSSYPCCTVSNCYSFALCWVTTTFVL